MLRRLTVILVALLGMAGQARAEGVCTGGDRAGFACLVGSDCTGTGGGNCNVQTYYPFLTSFETQGDADSGTAKDPHDVVEHFAGSGVTDATLHVQQTIVYDERNGGHSTSDWTATASVTGSDASAYYTRDFGLSGDVFDPLGTGYQAFATGVALHVAAVPGSGARAVLGMVESDGSWGDWGCFAEITSGRDVEVYYHVGDGTEACSVDGDCRNGTTLCATGDTACTCKNAMCVRAISTATVSVVPDSCSEDRTLACTPATEATDCPAPAGCGDADSLCTASNDCKWVPTLELAQRNVSAQAVICDAWLNGEILTTSVTTAFPGSVVGPVHDVGTGYLPIGTRSGGSTWTMYWDDWRGNVDATTQATPRTGHGYLVALHPAGDSSEQTWARNQCGANEHRQCIDDFSGGGAMDESGTVDWVRKNQTMNRRESFCAMTTPTIDLGTDARIATVDVQTYMEPGTAGGVLWRGNFAGLMQCPLCEASGDTTLNETYACQPECDSGASSGNACTLGVCSGGDQDGQDCVLTSDCTGGGTCVVSSCTGTASCTANACTAGVNIGEFCTLAAHCPATCLPLCEGSGGTRTATRCTSDPADSCACVSNTTRAFSYQTNSANQVFGFRFGADAPVDGVNATWSTTTLADLGFFVETARGYCSNDPPTACTNNGDCSGGGTCTGGMQVNDGNRIHAVLGHAYVRRPDIPRPVTGGDHNVGPEDDIYAILLLGDSALTGTSGSLCQGGTRAGQPCTYSHYCNWDGERRDKPTGGCAGDHDRCKTCVGTQGGSLGNGAGSTCADTTECEGSCVSGACDTKAIEGKPCTHSGSGEGGCDVGPCDDTAECVESCPGGTCPSYGTYGWGAGIVDNIGADVIYRCAVGGETAFGAVFKKVMPPFKELVGYGAMRANCSVDRGMPGRCRCQYYASSPHADCPGGTCEDLDGGACGPGEYCACNGGTYGQCGTYQSCSDPQSLQCIVPPPDVIVSLLGHNDQGAAIDPNSGDINLNKEPNLECASPKFALQNSRTALAHSSWAASWDDNYGLPPADCPTLGQAHPLSGSDYQCPTVTSCLSDADCAGISPRSMCVGVCNHAPVLCLGNYMSEETYGVTSIQLNTGCGPPKDAQNYCGTASGWCDLDEDCPNFTDVGGTAQTCSGGSGRASIETRGRCVCDDTTTHSDCPAGTCSGGSSPPGTSCHTQATCTGGGVCVGGYVCHGASGMCRRSCDGLSDLQLACTGASTSCTDGACVNGPHAGETGCSTAQQCAECRPGGTCASGTCETVGLACETDGEVNVQKGVCTCPCDAITCTSDADCGEIRVGPDGDGTSSGAYVTPTIGIPLVSRANVPNVVSPVPQDHYQMRSKYQGLCNRYADGNADADGKCRCCGGPGCLDPKLEPSIGGGCSCLVDADCKVGDGTCNESAATCQGGANDGDACTTKTNCPDGECVGVCTGTTTPCRADAECNGDCNTTTYTCDPLIAGNYRSRRGLCQRDGDCAPDHQCINCIERALQVRRTYERTFMSGALLMQQIIDEFGEGCGCTTNADCSPSCVNRRCGNTRTQCRTDADCAGTCATDPHDAGASECATGPRATCRSSVDCGAGFDCNAPRMVHSEAHECGGVVTAGGYESGLFDVGDQAREVAGFALARDCPTWRGGSDLATNVGDHAHWDFWRKTMRTDPRYPSHLVCNQTVANRDRVGNAHHVIDGCHYNLGGGIAVGLGCVTSVLEKINVCQVTAGVCTSGSCVGGPLDGTSCRFDGDCRPPQKYCRLGPQDFETATCTSSTCDGGSQDGEPCDDDDDCLGCDDDADCAYRCTTKPCDRQESACPLSTDVCGPD